MKKIVSMIAGILVLISAAVTAGAEKISIANEKYPAPGYAGAVMLETTEKFEPLNNVSLFSLCNDDMRTYMYNILMDVDLCKTYYRDGIRYIDKKIVIDETTGKEKEVKETKTGKFIVINLSKYNVTNKELSDLMNSLINESGELLLDVNYVTIYSGTRLTEVGVNYAYDIDEIKDKRSRIEEKRSGFISSLGDWKQLTERERVLLTHDFIASNAYYAPSDINNIKYHTLYSALVEGVTVCQGYTQAMCYILPQIGVKCVSCLNDYGNHVWNCVNVDGQWSHVDLTWDDARNEYEYMDNGKKKVAMFDFVSYGNFMTDAATMIANKKNGYDLDKYKGVFDKSEFTFPSGKLTYDETAFDYNNEFAYNYFGCYGLNTNGNITFFLPSGFSYKNGKIVHSYKQMNINNELKNEYKFVYAGLKAMNCAASMPEKINNSYSFMLLPLKDKADMDNINIYMTSYENDEIQIDELKINGYSFNSSGVYFINTISNENLNPDQAKFFFWDSNMRPYTQPTYKSIQ